MKEDKELLELAAKAAGYNIKAHEDGTLYSDYRCAGYWGVFNPLRDDGDALRLAVKLNLVVDFGENQVKVFFENKVSVSYNIRGDKADIARRAIVRAAAAVGEKL